MIILRNSSTLLLFGSPHLIPCMFVDSLAVFLCLTSLPLRAGLSSSTIFACFFLTPPPVGTPLEHKRKRICNNIRHTHFQLKSRIQ